MRNLRSIFRSERSFIGFGVICLLLAMVGLLLPDQLQEGSGQSSSYGDPDQFAAHFAEIQGETAGYPPYPQGHKFREFQRAVHSSAKRGTSVELPWVERGPGNIGGRTRAVVLDPSDPDYNTWYIGSVGGGVWRGRRMEIGGRERVEWVPLTDHLPSLAVSALDVSRNNPDVLYVGTGEGFFNVDAAAGVGMFKTTDRGATWTHLSSTIARTYDDDWRFVNRLVVHPDNPDIVVAATNRGIFRTEDGGVTFQNVYRHTQPWGPVQDLRVNPDNFDIQFATVNRHGILRSMDGGKTWQNSLVEFAYPKYRIEIAISQSNSNVIWAVAEGSRARQVTVGFNNQKLPVTHLYRSLDNGESWRFVDRFPDIRSAFLQLQGWYDMSIVVHPYDPDLVYIGGIDVWEAEINPFQDVRRRDYGIVDSMTTKHEEYFLLNNFGGGSSGGRLDMGYLVTDQGEIPNIVLNDMTSVEIRFGPGQSQKAHRFTVKPDAGTYNDGEAGVRFGDYYYEDYVDVPFEVWDTDNNRQLMVSFRDQIRDGVFDLVKCGSSERGCNGSREYIFVSKYDYNASTPRPEISKRGGLRDGLMYFMWPSLHRESEEDFDINREETIKIYFSQTNILVEGYTIKRKWNGIDIHVDHHALLAVPIDESTGKFFLFNGNDGGFAYSYDSGSSWAEGDYYAGLNTSQFYDAVKQPGEPRYVGGMQDNSSFISYRNPDNRRPWERAGTDDGFDAIWKSADSIIVSAQLNKIIRTVSGDRGWRITYDKDPTNGQFMTSFAWTPASKDVVFMLSPIYGPMRSLNFGASNSFRPVKLRWPIWIGRSGKVRLSLADPSVLWGGYVLGPDKTSDGILHVSENALAAPPGEGVRNPVIMRPVTPASTAPTALFSGLATHPFSRATAYVMFSVACQPKLFRTEDMGRSWEDLSGFEHNSGEEDKCDPSTNGFPDADVYDIEVMPGAPRIIWAGTDLGLFESRDHGKTWAYADNGLPAVSIWRIRIVDDEIILATHGRGVWTVDLNQVQTSSSPSVAGVPDAFELSGNYPNPFNPTTNITFRVANASHIRVTVFDVLGRKVATLTDQAYEGGTHEIRWDASQVSSGQYIYRMEADGKVIGAKSMLLVK